MKPRLALVLAILMTVAAVAVPVTQLDLSAQGFTSLPVQLKNYRDLRSLDLSFNKLTDFDPPPALAQLEAVALNANRLDHQPTSLARLRRLRYLWLDGNSLTRFTGWPGPLVSLSLDANCLTSVDSLGGFGELCYLNLSDNALTRLPGGAGRLHHLEILDLSGNQIDVLGDELGSMRALQVLDLSRNKLRSLPDQVVQLKDLVRLELAANQLEKYPEQINQLTNLEYLSLVHNPGLEIPDSIANLKRLRVLYIDRALVDPARMARLLPRTAVVSFPDLFPLGPDGKPILLTPGPAGK